MTVGSLLDEMTYEELQGWMSYFEQRPIGWRDDDRVYKLLQAEGVKEKSWNIFPSLKAIYQRPKSDEFDVAGLKSSSLFRKMLSAKGGDSINYD